MLSFNMGESVAMNAYAKKDMGLSRILPFCITRIGDFSCSDRYFTKRFGLDECLALFTIDGQGLMQYKAEEIIAGSGDIVVINCNNYQYYKTYGNSGWHFKWIHFSGLCAATLVDHINAKGIFMGKIDSDIETQLGFIFESVQKTPIPDEYGLSLALHSILTNIQKQQRTSDLNIREKNQTGKEELNNALAFMGEHYKNKISLAEIAKASSMSEYHFIRVFSAYTGYTPYDYIITLRIHEAKRLLIETKMQISEIAEETGFSEAKALISNFKKKEGVTPLFYRNNYGFSKSE